MTKKLIFLTSIFGLISTGVLFSQEAVKKSYKKEVRMEEDNGTKTLYITTNENGKISEEVYTGEEAEVKLSELTEGVSQTEEIKKEVYMEEINGEKTLTIITSKKGKVREEKFTGEDAERKLEELEGAQTEDEKLRLKQK